MVIIATAMAVAAVVVALRWWTRRYDSLGRARSFPYVSVGLLLALSAGSVTPSILRHREEDRLSSVASQLVGANVVVHCQTLGQAFTQLTPDLGYVPWGPDGVPERQTFIKHGPCSALRAYLGSDKDHPSSEQIVAVHILTHESMHMRGIKDEAAAECAAMQRDATTAELLGADQPHAEELARIYWQVDYPLMPSAYRSADCAPGGALDEHLPMAPWAAPTP